MSEAAVFDPVNPLVSDAASMERFAIRCLVESYFPGAELYHEGSSLSPPPVMVTCETLSGIVEKLKAALGPHAYQGVDRVRATMSWSPDAKIWTVIILPIKLKEPTEG